MASAVSAGRSALCLILLAAPLAHAMSPKTAPPLPPPSGTVVNVSTAWTLREAINNAANGATIMVADGTYYVSSPQALHINNRNNVTIRGASGDPTKVILRGYGFGGGNLSETLIIISSSHNILLADMTFMECRANGVQVQAETFPTNIHFYNCHFRNIGERQIKGSGGSGKAQGGSVRYCRFENTLIPPDTWTSGGNYITAIDMMALDGWEFSDNYFKDIKGASGSARAAIFVWQNSANVTVERNVIIDCDRGIAFGNPGGSSSNPHVIGGVIYNNFIIPGPDAGIELWHVDNARIRHNTIWRSDTTRRGVRGGSDTLPLTNVELTNNIIRGTDLLSGGVTRLTNYTGSVAGYFESQATGNLRLTENAVNVINQGTPLSEPTDDYDSRARGIYPDIGASEFQGGPEANAGPDQTAYTGETVTLNGSASTGQAGMTYSWSRDGGSGPAVTLSGANTSTASFTPTSVGTYVFRLSVSDSIGSSEDTVEITVNGLLANAGPDRTVGRGARVTLDGAASRGIITSYLWEHVSGDVPVSLGMANTAAASFTAGPADAVHLFRLTVSGPSGTSADEVEITVGALSAEVVCSQHVEVRGELSEGAWSDAGSFSTSETARTLGNANDEDYRELLLMRFDMASIPAGAEIVSVTLRVYCHDDHDPRGSMVRVFGGNEPWTASATYLTRDGSNPWSGGRVVASMDAAWSDQRINNATQLSSGNPNPDYTNALYSDGDNWTGRWIDFDVTEVAGGWASGSRANHGLVLASTNFSQAEGGTKVNWGYVAMQWRTSAHPTDKPHLVVRYYKPIASSTSGCAASSESAGKPLLIAALACVMAFRSARCRRPAPVRPNAV